jgi:uncharacterized membrane protein
MNMEMQFPGDVRDAHVRGRRNIGEVERWASVLAGASLALYGLKQRSPKGVGLAVMGGLLARRGAVGHCHVYEALDLNTASTSNDTRRALGGDRGTRVQESVTVNRPVEDLYRFWRNLDNLPRFMQHLESVERISDTESRWRARGPGGTVVQWTAEIINEIPNELIAWRTLDGSDVVSAGSVHFDAVGRSGRATRLRVRLQYSPPGGKLAASVAKLLRQDPAAEIRADLRRFKQLIETGEVSTTEGQPRGR